MEPKTLVKTDKKFLHIYRFDDSNRIIRISGVNLFLFRYEDQRSYINKNVLLITTAVTSVSVHSNKTSHKFIKIVLLKDQELTLHATHKINSSCFCRSIEMLQNVR